MKVKADSSHSLKRLGSLNKKLYIKVSWRAPKKRGLWFFVGIEEEREAAPNSFPSIFSEATS